MAEDDLTLQIKLEWTQRRLEESETLARSLRSNVEGLLGALDDLTHRNDVLKARQNELVADKSAADARVEELLQEKSELAAENASLRSVAREARDRAVLSHAADDLVAQAAAVADKGASSSLGPQDASTADRLQASRLLVARLLWVIHRAGVRVTDQDLLGLGESAGAGAGAGADGQGQGQGHGSHSYLRQEAAEAIVASLRLQQEVEALGGCSHDHAHSHSHGHGHSHSHGHGHSHGMPDHRAAGVAAAVEPPAVAGGASTRPASAGGGSGGLPPPPPGTRFGPLPPPPGMDQPPGSRQGSRTGSRQGSAKSLHGQGQGDSKDKGGREQDGAGEDAAAQAPARAGLLSSFFSLLVGDVTPLPPAGNGAVPGPAAAGAGQEAEGSTGSGAVAVPSGGPRHAGEAAAVGPATPPAGRAPSDSASGEG